MNVSVVTVDPAYVGRLENAPKHVFGDRVIKVIFEVPEGVRLKDGVSEDDLRQAQEQIVAREALLDGFYQRYAILIASRNAIKRTPLLLTPGRRFWVLGFGQYFGLGGGSAGNWAESGAVVEAKSVLGAQIYRVERLLDGATTQHTDTPTSNFALAFCDARIRPRLEGLLRTAGSRQPGRTWETYVQRIRNLFGTPLVRRLYGEAPGARTRLKVGARWQEEGRRYPILVADIERLNRDAPFWGKEILLLEFAADLVARATIQAEQGAAEARRNDRLTDEIMAAIVDNDSAVAFDQAVEAALRWDVNAAASFHQLGAYTGILDAARALGKFRRLGVVELPGLASHGIRSLARLDGNDAFEGDFLLSCRRLLEQMPDEMVSKAEFTPPDVFEAEAHGRPSNRHLLTMLFGALGGKDPPSAGPD